MEKFIMPNAPEDASIEKINNEPEKDPEGFDDNKYNDIPGDNIRKRAEEILEKYGDGKKSKITNKGDNARAMTIKGEKTAIENKNEKKLSSEEVEAVVEKYLNGKERTSVKEKRDFGDFVKEKIDKPITRRDALKLIIGGAAAALFISKDYLLDNINVWWSEFQEQEENGYEIEYSKEMTALYEKTKNLPEGEIDNAERVSKNLKNIDKNFEHAEFIKNSDRENIEILPELLEKENNDVIIFSEYHGAKSNAINTVKVLENLKKWNSKKISKIGLEGLDYTDSESIELVKKFNNNQISVNDFYFKSYFRTDIRPLLEFAQKNNIPIEGIEDYEKLGRKYDETNGFKRFTRLSHKVGLMAKEKKDDEIIIIFSGANHATINNWETDSTTNYLSQIKAVIPDLEEKKKLADENDYTFKEYLNKISFKSSVINLKDLNHMSHFNDHIMAHTSAWLTEKDFEKQSRKWEEKWNNYKSGKNEPYLIIPQSEKESYEIINPSNVPETPPALNVFKTIKNNHPEITEMIRKNNYVDYQPIEYNMFLVSQTGDGIGAKMADIDLKSGKIKKLFLPEQLKK